MSIGTESAHRELQLTEHNLQQLLAQRQALQLEYNEITNALNELALAQGDTYKVMGNIMMRADKSRLAKELEERKKSLELHLSTLDKQEQVFEKKIVDLQKKTVDKKG